MTYNHTNIDLFLVLNLSRTVFVSTRASTKKQYLSNQASPDRSIKHVQVKVCPSPLASWLRNASRANPDCQEVNSTVEFPDRLSSSQMIWLTDFIWKTSMNNSFLHFSLFFFFFPSDTGLKYFAPANASKSQECSRSPAAAARMTNVRLESSRPWLHPVTVVG